MPSTHVNTRQLRKELAEYFDEKSKNAQGQEADEMAQCRDAVLNMESEALCKYAEEIGVNMKRFTFVC